MVGKGSRMRRNETWNEISSKPDESGVTGNPTCKNGSVSIVTMLADICSVSNVLQVDQLRDIFDKKGKCLMSGRL